MEASPRSRLVGRIASPDLAGLVAAVVVLMLGMGSLAHAQEAAAEDDGPLLFRRIYATADSVMRWPLDNLRYLPVAAEEFERLVEAIRSLPSDASVSPAASWSRAEYVATLNELDLLSGTAVLDVDHRIQATTLLPIAPCNIAVSQPKWQPRLDEAVLGIDDAGRLLLSVDRKASLTFDWSLKGQRDLTGAVRFQLELPACAATSVVLRLPADLHPLAAKCAIEAPRAGGEGFQEWRIHAGGQTRLSLELVKASSDERPRGLNLLREAVTYGFLPLGVEVTSVLQLDVHHEPLRQLELELEGGLQLFAARYGETAVPWSVRQDERRGVSRAVLELPEAILGSGRMLSVAALGPLVTDGVWRLPRIRPRGVFWQEGTATLIVPAPLSIESLEPVLCRQSRVGLLPGQASEESIELQCFSQDATIEVVLARRRQKVQMAVGASVLLEADQMSCVVVAQMQSLGDERFELLADAPFPWLIDSVESIPSGGVAKWTTTPGAPGSRLLRIRLSRALATNNPLRLIISGHTRSSPRARNLRADDLTMLKFRDAAAPRPLLSVRAIDPFRLRLNHPEEMRRIDAVRLSDAERDLFLEPPEGLVVELGPEVLRWSVSMDRERTEFHAEASVDAAVTSGRLDETYRIGVEPVSGRVERLVVSFSEARASPPYWMLGNERQPPSAARRWTVEEQTSAGISPAAETWELRLPRTASEAFVVRAERQSAFARSANVSLVSLVDASEQAGSVKVRLLDDLPLAIEPVGIDAVPTSSASPDAYSRVRGAFRYDPPVAVTQATPCALRLSTSGAAQSPAAIAWECRLDSRYQADGAARHRATYRVQNSGRGECRVRLPPGATIVALRLDGDEIVAAQTDEGIVIELDSTRRRRLVEVVFSTRSAAWSAFQTIALHAPSIDMPVISTRWTVSLPPSFEAIGPLTAFSGDLRQTAAWSQRLFGGLARRRGVRPFDPVDGADWAELLVPSAARANAWAQARGLIEALGAVASGDDREASPTWSDALSRAAARLAGRVDVLVDLESLARQAIDAESRAPHVDASTTVRYLDRGLAMLDAAGLALVVGDRATILTTADAVLENRGQIEPLWGGEAAWLLDGELALQLDAAGRSPRFITLAAWSSQAPVRWPAEYDTSWSSASAAAGNVYAMTVDAASPASLNVASTTAVRIACWLTFWTAAVACAAGARWTKRRPMLVLSLLAMLALAAPSGWWPLASAAVVGAIVGFASRALSRPLTHSPAGLERSSVTRIRSHAAPSAVAGALIAAAALAAGGRAPTYAQQIDGQPAPLNAPRSVYRVFIPTDEKGAPTGDRYHVPEAFDAELRRRVREAYGEPRGWLLKKARYTGSLAVDADGSRLAVDSFRAHYDVDVFEHEQTVRIPLSRDGVELIEDSSLVDGRPAEIAWDDAGQAVLCRVDWPGAYHIELALRPVVRTSDRTNEFQFATPTLATSALDLSFPAQTSNVAVPSAYGRVEVLDQGTRLHADLGPAGRLVVRWSDRLALAVEPEVEIEELLWLKIRPGSVVVEARYKLDVLEGSIQDLLLSADPRLRLLPSSDADSPIAEVRVLDADATRAGAPQTIQWIFDRSVADSLRFSTAFLLSGVSGVGNVRFPKLEIQNARSTRRWMAVSIDPSLEFDTPIGDHTKAIPVAEFVEQWQAPASTPQFAGEWPPGDTVWSVATRPRSPRITGRQSLALRCRRGGVLVEFDAALDTSSGYSFQHRLLAAANLEIESVSVLEGGAERAQRWSRDDRGLVTVFLSGPVTGAHDLELRAWLPTPPTGKVVMPLVRLDGPDVAPLIVRLYRDATELAAVEERQGLTELAEFPAAADAAIDAPRPAGSFRVDAADPSAMLALASNEAEFEVVQATSLSEDQGAWMAECRAIGNVVQGVVDLLRFRVPDSWSGPFEITPAMPSAMIAAPGESGRQLVLRPPAALRGPFEISLRGPVAAPPGGRVVAYDIAPVGATRSVRFFKLPTQVGLEQVEWETLRLRPVARLPQEFGASSLPREAHRIFRVIGEDSRATMRVVERTVEEPRVELADVAVRWDESSALRGVASFAVRPAGMSRVTVRVTDDMSIVSVAVDDRLVAPLATTERTWVVALTQSRFPQRVEVVFSGRLAARASVWRPVRLASPVIEGLPIAEQLWTVWAPRTAGDGTPQQAELASAARMELARLRAWSRVAELPSETAPLERFEDVERWYRATAAALLAAERNIARATLREPAFAARQYRIEAASLAAANRREAERLGLAEVLDELAGSPPLVDTFHDEAALALSDDATAVACIVRAPSSASLSVAYRRSAASSLAARMILSIALVGLALAVGRWRGGDEAVRRWPAAIGVCIGLAWWLWLAPSIVGLVIAAVSLCLAVRSGLVSHREAAFDVRRFR